MFFDVSAGHMTEISIGTAIFGISANNGAGFRDSRPNPLLGAWFRAISLFSSSSGPKSALGPRFSESPRTMVQNSGILVQIRGVGMDSWRLSVWGVLGIV